MVYNPNQKGAGAIKNGAIKNGKPEPPKEDAEEAAPAAAPKEEPKQTAVTNSSGQIALAGSSIDPAYEKAKAQRRANRGAQAKALANY